MNYVLCYFKLKKRSLKRSFYEKIYSPFMPKHPKSVNRKIGLFIEFLLGNNLMFEKRARKK